MKILISSNTAWYLFNFRSGLIKALKTAGHEVLAVAPRDEYVGNVESLGARFINIDMDNQGRHPLKDLALFLRYFLLIKREKPDLFLGNTIKPNIYGTLAARALGTPTINNISGLGTAFIKETFITRIVEFLYRISIKNSLRVFFQNEDDLELFKRKKLVREGNVLRIPGSGVDPNYFKSTKSDLKDFADRKTFKFLLPARLLRDKGVGEFVQAARILKKLDNRAEFLLVGFLDVLNRTAVARSEVEAWEKEGLLKYLGSTNDMISIYNQVDCVVLPSYREGLSRVLLEAASMSKPIITTDVPGCRDVVKNGITGFVCKVKDFEDLAEKMKMMLNLTEWERKEMGKRAREMIVAEFDEKIIIQHYFAIIKEIGI